MDKILIIGAGHAGDAAAAMLRQYGHAGPITLLGEEGFAPYHRPPLSKAWLKGEMEAAAIALRAADFYERQNISLRLSTRAAAIDRHTRRVRLLGREDLPYDHLILATGARARALAVPGAELAHVHVLRSRRDADALRRALVPGTRLTIIGGGYIGLEIAAAARALGVAVTLLEREAGLLARVASPALAGFFQRLHTARGVRMHLAAQVSAITEAAVILADGTAIPSDHVLIGVGAQPNIVLAEAAGLDCTDGIMVDQTARTTDPAIFAIGDCANRAIAGARIRLESVPNALEQAKQAAAAITGRAAPAAETPWFWSDQYGVRLQIAGLLRDVHATIPRGDLHGATFALFHLDADGTVCAVEAVNAAEEFMAGRAMIHRRRIPDPSALANPAIPMRMIAA